jgi:hypothetical protein
MEIGLTNLVQCSVPDVGIMESAEHPIADPTIPTTPNITTATIVIITTMDNLLFCVNTARMSKRIEHFESASAM